jgi:hypothetical protein
MKNCIISIDPGASGGLAILHHDSVTVHKMPETPTDLCDIIRAAQSDAGINGCGVKAFVEKVGGYMGGDPAEPRTNMAPATAMFEFGKGAGQIEGMLIALKIPFEMVLPRTWQRALNIGVKGLQRGKYTHTMTDEQRRTEKRRVTSINGRLNTAWKNRIKDVAQRRFPQIKVTLAVSDALCLLMHAMRQENIPITPPPQAQLI